MTIAEVELKHLVEARNLRVIGVQLASPIRPGPNGQAELTFNAEAKRPIWHHHQLVVEHRIEKIQGVLRSLAELYANQPLDIIAFPEYSVPREAHDACRFQAFADEHACILIPGTYVDDRPDHPASYRRNMCRIYIPGREEPLLIGKRTPTPEESKYVEPYDGANIARLVWQPPGRPEAVSISVFICRDYLTPYSVAPGAHGPGAHRELDVDWDREGLHIALIHSDETRQFEGVAGLDLRNLRGRRKMSLIVNNANWARELGSALFGPALNRERDDIVRSLPPDKETILSAELRLWDVRAAVERPDRTIDEPISLVREHPLAPPSVGEASVESVRRHLIVPGADSIALDNMPDDTVARFRGIWRTAFLAAERMALSLEFYKVERLIQAIDIVKNDVKNAYTGVVRGEHDLMIRRYVNLNEVEQPGGADFTKQLDASRRREFLAAQGYIHDSAMKVVVYAHDIWKYRGRCTIDESFEGSRQDLHDLLQFPPGHGHARQTLIRAIWGYAAGCDEGARPPHLLEPFFYPEPEETIAVRPFTELRETLIFLHITENGSESSPRFEREMLRGLLMVDPLVREICKLSARSVFNYLLKLKCKAHEADEMGRTLRRWCEEHGLECAMRTVDVTEYLHKESVEGIEAASRDQSFSEFIGRMRSEALKEDDERITRLLSTKSEAQLNVVTSCARAWERCHTAAGADATRKLRSDILSFFGQILLYSAASEEKYLNKAMDAWMHIYQALERAANETLIKLFEASFDHPAPIDEFARNDELKALLAPKWKSGSGRSTVASISAWRIGCSRSSLAQAPIAGALKSSLSAIDKSVREDRNDFAHRTRPKVMRERLDVGGQDAAEKCANLAARIEAMVQGYQPPRRGRGTRGQATRASADHRRALAASTSSPKPVPRGPALTWRLEF